MAWEWYGVKTWYRIEAKGRPRFTDEDYDGDATLVEERIVLVKARNFDEAIRKGEKEAKAYANNTRGLNIYGQQLTVRYLGSYYVFWLFDAPDVGVEVYSNTEMVSKRVSDKSLLQRFKPKEISEAEQWQRLKFIDGDITRAMLESFEKDT